MNGSPATGVSGSDAGPYVFTGFAPPAAPPPDGTTPVSLVLGAGTIRDRDGNGFAGDTWENTIEPDRDGDYFPDRRDNCPDVPNPGQLNTDQLVGAYHGAAEGAHDGLGLGDGLGDACDLDDDGDGIPDAVELATESDPRNWRDPDPCPFDPLKTAPGDCGCGWREIDRGGGEVDCVLSVSCSASAAQLTQDHHVHPQATPPACDDGDACTIDACVDGPGCTSTPVTGLAAASCVCNRGALEACAGRPMAKAPTRAAAKACRLLAKAGAPGTKTAKAKKLLKGAARQWKAAMRATGKKKAVKQLGAPCVQALTDRYRDAQVRAATATTGP